MKATQMFRILMATLLAGALALGLAACGDDDEAASSTSEEMSQSETGETGDGETGDGGTGDGETGDGETGDGGTTLPTSGESESASAPLSCEACIEASCSEEQAACDAEPDCGGLLACAAECDDQDCISACSAANPGGIAVFLPLFTCIQNECPICLEDDGEETMPEESGTTPEPGGTTEIE